MMMQFSNRPLARIVLMMIFAAPWLSCTRVVPVRTLPNWVRAIYVPMIENKTTEPGLEEVATTLIQEEFLADGRLDIVKKRRADLKLVATIEEYISYVEEEDSDDIAETNELIILATVKLYDPFDDENPLADLGLIKVPFRYNADPRSIGYVVKPDVKRLALRQLARMIVNRTINGFPADLGNLPDSVRMPKVTGPKEAPQGDIFRNKSGRVLD